MGVISILGIPCPFQTKYCKIVFKLVVHQMGWRITSDKNPGLKYLELNKKAFTNWSGVTYRNSYLIKCNIWKSTALSKPYQKFDSHL